MMTNIKIGIALQNYFWSDEYIHPKQLIKTATLAEELGFDSVWVWDHIILGSKRYYPVHESFMVLAAVAAHTSKIRLGTGVYILPLRNPVVVAKQLATLDHLSDGRITFGVAAGWYEREFKAVGVPFKKRGEILVRNIMLVKKLLSEEVVEGVYNGFDLDKVRIEPKPVQKPHPPIWLGGYVEKALERVGMLGDGWISYFYKPSSFFNSWQKILNYAKKHGRNTVEISNCLILPALIADNRETGMKRVSDFVRKYCDLPPWSEASVESALTGSKEECREYLNRYIESGVKEIVLMPVFENVSQINLKLNDLAKALL